jgi:hypothetical protein
LIQQQRPDASTIRSAMQQLVILQAGQIRLPMVQLRSQRQLLQLALAIVKPVMEMTSLAELQTSRVLHVTKPARPVRLPMLSHGCREIHMFTQPRTKGTPPYAGSVTWATGSLLPM